MANNTDICIFESCTHTHTQQQQTNSPHANPIIIATQASREIRTKSSIDFLPVPKVSNNNNNNKKPLKSKSNSNSRVRIQHLTLTYFKLIRIASRQIDRSIY